MQHVARALRFVPPMECKPADALPNGDEWQYELKLDGYRVQAIKNNREVRLYSRNGKPFEDRFPEIAEAVQALRAQEFILDGEIVALDAQGGHSFSALQKAGARRPPLRFYAFDLLTLDGKDLTMKPLWSRRNLLETQVPMPQGITHPTRPSFSG